MVDIVRLKKEDYDELLSLYNLVFTKQNQRLMDFTKELPRMWIRDDEHMGKHFAVKENGKICAALGVYPLQTNIMGEKLLFSTVGNVATHPDFEGRGYMKMLMGKAMEELEKIGADASRLGGLRQRYNHYNYEYCGEIFHFAFTERNRKLCCHDIADELRFLEVGENDEKAIRQIAEWNKKQKINVSYAGEYETRDVYLALRAWDNRIFIARNDNGDFVGYVCAFPDGGTLARVGAADKKSLVQTICSWQKLVDKTIEFSLAPYQIEEVAQFSDICENFYIGSPSMFKIINWEKVVRALLKLKSSYVNLPDGKFVIKIEQYGKLCLIVRNNECFCEKTDEKEEITLNRLQAARFLFGPISPEYYGVKNIAVTWFPLPLYWDMQDRV